MWGVEKGNYYDYIYIYIYIYKYKIFNTTFSPSFITPSEN